MLFRLNILNKFIIFFVSSIINLFCSYLDILYGRNMNIDGDYGNFLKLSNETIIKLMYIPSMILLILYGIFNYEYILICFIIYTLIIYFTYVAFENKLRLYV